MYVKFVTIKNILLLDFTVAISIITKIMKIAFSYNILRKDEKYGLFVN